MDGKQISQAGQQSARPQLSLPPMSAQPNNATNDSRKDSSARMLEQATNQTFYESPLTPMNPDVEGELFGTGPNGSMPQLDVGVKVTEGIVMAEVPSENTTIESMSSGDGTSQHDTLHSNGHHIEDGPPSGQTNVEQAGETTEDGGCGATLMPPPTAAASMLSLLRPSKRAKAPAQQITDPAVVARLVSASVILFRQGKGVDAKRLGQYTVDLVGQEVWDEELPDFMKAEPLPSDGEAVVPLIVGAVDIIKQYDPASSAFLDGMLYAWN